MGRRGKLGYMSDSGAIVSVPPVLAADPACDVAHGKAPLPPSTRTLVAVFSSPVARFLLGYARDAGYRPVLVDPGTGLLPGRDASHDGAEHDTGDGAGADALDALLGLDGLTTAATLAGLADEATDVVVTDHHRPELGTVLRDALASPARWVGILGNPRHPAPHIPALAALGVPADQIARVHRPIGLNIGSRTPAEIALATMAGLIADRNGRPGGFEF
jgi:xanthine dehydrogenase accessory factor